MEAVLDRGPDLLSRLWQLAPDLNDSDDRAPTRKFNTRKDFMESQKDVDGASCPSRCSIAPHVPNLPPEAIEFAEAVGQLCEKYSIAKVDMKVEVDRFTREHEYREDIVSDMTINVSTIDRRGRPRKKIYVQAQLYVSVPIVWEPDSTN